MGWGYSISIMHKILIDIIRVCLGNIQRACFNWYDIPMVSIYDMTYGTDGCSVDRQTHCKEP